MQSKLALSALALALGLMASTAFAVDRSSPSALPMVQPKAAPEMMAPAQKPPGQNDDSLRMAPGMSKPAGAEELIDSLAAVKATRGGKILEVPLPGAIRMMLRNPVKQGKITPKPGGGKLIQVKNTSEFPYTAMGLVGSGCTGTLVSKRFVITAALCIYDVKNKKFYDNLDFYPAINGKDQPFGVSKWADAYVPKGYTKDGALEYDFGLIVLEDDGLGDKAGWMGFGHLEEFDLKQVTLTGYPWEGVPQQTEWQSTCEMDAAEANFLFYRCPGDSKTLASMSGSPIWYKGKTDQDWQVLGIHNYAQDDKKNSWWALRLNEANTQILLAWIDEANKAGGGGGGKTTEDTGGGDTEDTGDTTDCTCKDQGDN